MQILLASPRGFCAGVNMAIDCLDEAIKMFGPNIYVYHEIVHNRYVVERFTSQGVTFVEDISQVPEGSLLLYTRPRRLADRRADARVATCRRSTPLVRW